MTTLNTNPCRFSASAVERFEARLNKTATCWLWTGAVIVHGYGNLRIRDDNTAAHRMSWELAYGPVPEGLWVLHRCDVKLCVRPDHLFLGTHRDNMNDMKAKGRQAAGIRHPAAKLTIEAVLTIRCGAHDAAARAELAQINGVSVSTVKAIQNGRLWRHV